LKTIVRDCMDYLKKEKNLSQNTLSSYERDIRQYVSFLVENGVSDTCKADRRMIEMYIHNLCLSGRSPSTISRCAASIRMLYRYMIRNGKISGNPIAGIEIPKVMAKPPDILTDEELSRLMSLLDSEGARCIRDKAIICMLSKTGIRVSELISINVGDIDFSNETAKLGDHRKSRRIPISGKCLSTIQEYLKMSRPYLLKESSEKALFINTKGNRLSRQGVWKILKKYSKLACPGKELTPYTLRHTLAACMLRDGSDIEDVQRLLGNRTRSTVVRYNRLIRPEL
jgi:integrase/recombinase XerD